MEINRWLHLSSSIWGDFSGEKFPIMATNNWIVLAVRAFFASSSLIFQKSCGEEKRHANAKRYVFQANAITNKKN